MSDLTFNCPWCDQHLEAPSEMAGEIILCPSCEKELRVQCPAQHRQPPVQRDTPAAPDSKIKVLAGIASGSAIVALALLMFLSSNGQRYRRAVSAFQEDDCARAIALLNKTSDNYQARTKVMQLRSYCLLGLAREAATSGQHDAVLDYLSGIPNHFQEIDEVRMLTGMASNEIAKLTREKKEAEEQNRRREAEKLEDERIEKQHKQFMEEAPQVAMAAVRKQLVSPYSAHFSDVITVYIEAHNTYNVFGNVDSQNAFGAMLRSRFSRYVRPSGRRLVDVTESLSGKEVAELLDSSLKQLKEMNERTQKLLEDINRR